MNNPANLAGGRQIDSDKLLLTLGADVLLGAQSMVGMKLSFHDCSAIIVETEAYRSDDDPAAHGYGGPTKRNQVMFEEPGRAYVYFSYGVHWMLNVTAHEPGRAAGVLIRAARPIEGIELMRGRRGEKLKDGQLLSGPGKVAQAFGITRDQNGLNLFDRDSPLRIEGPGAPTKLIAGTRIGLAKGKGDELLWRYIDADNLVWASKPWPRDYVVLPALSDSID